MLYYRGKLKQFRIKEETNRDTGEVYEKRFLHVVTEGESLTIQTPKDFTLENEGLTEGESYEFPIRIFNKYGVSEKTKKPYSFINYVLAKDEEIERL